MDKFVVDIDAVLDEFEESENKVTSSLAPPLAASFQPASSVASPPPPSNHEPPPDANPDRNDLQSRPVADQLCNLDVLPNPTHDVPRETSEDFSESKRQDEPVVVGNSGKESETDNVSTFVERSPAVKPKTPLNVTKQTTPSHNKTSSPRVSSEQFDEFLRKKSIENAHLLSAHNSPVLQRFRSSSTGVQCSKSPVSTTVDQHSTTVDAARSLVKAFELAKNQEAINDRDGKPSKESKRKPEEIQTPREENDEVPQKIMNGQSDSKPKEEEKEQQTPDLSEVSGVAQVPELIQQVESSEQNDMEICQRVPELQETGVEEKIDEILVEPVAVSYAEEEKGDLGNVEDDLAGVTEGKTVEKAGGDDFQENCLVDEVESSTGEETGNVGTAVAELEPMEKTEETSSHVPLKSDTSNFYRIVSFDMSAVEVTDDDLHMLEDEVQENRAPSRRSQDSEASVEPVDPDQTIESAAAENVVNNNDDSEATRPAQETDNPFDVPERRVSQENTTIQETSVENASPAEVEIEDSSPQETPKAESSEDAGNSNDGEPLGAVGGEPETVVAPSEGLLGKVRPMWIHDEDAPICMNCGQDFTMFRRRHHCRACGKVLCGNCCKDKARLQFMDGELARVCSYCIEILNKVERWSRPDPSNPMEYCSTVSPLAQISSTAQLPPPTVMVPVGVLKKGGEKSNTSGSGLGGSSGCSKSVMFSDGIRPGGDLTDLDIPSTPPAQRTPQRTLKQLATGRSKASVARKYRKYVSVTDSLGCLPNVLLSNKFKPYDQPMPAGTLFNLLQDPTLPPVSFELTRHKVQLRVKIVNLDCCHSSRVWSFCSEGLAAFGQEEIAFILEYHADDELAVPRDVFKLYKLLYGNACKGTPVIQMDHLLFPGGLLGSNEHAGVLFLRTTLQCTENIVTPLHENNYLVAMLIMRSEVPWAKLFPLRLQLRLGAEFRYYPCPLVSKRFRKAVYFDGDQHSIMSILADFRNYQYTIQNIPGLVIHVVGKKYTIKAPRNRYDLMMKASTTNENILAIGSNFSATADSHLVCIQGEDGSFQSQTINIASLPVKVTGASFLVFSGALKSNSGFTAKSSIVEDGILVQIGPQEMAKLKQAIHAMENYRIVCKETSKTAETTEAAEEEYVELQWVENEVTRNESVLSAVDGSLMAGIPSCKIFSGTDYSNDKFVVRWTELFFLASKDTELDLPDPNRLIEATARSMCVALLPHAAKLYEQDLKKVALRISLDPEQFGYELGAGGSPLTGEFLSEVDNALVPIITSLDGSHQPMTIELVFYVLLK